MNNVAPGSLGERRLEIDKYLFEHVNDVVAVFPQHFPSTVDYGNKFVQSAINCMETNMQIFACSKESILSSVLRAAELGLVPSKVFGTVYFVVYGTVCTFMTGYRGLIELAKRSPQVLDIEAHVVHANDVFTIKYGVNQELSHSPCITGERGDVIGSYMLARLSDSLTKFEFMRADEIEDIRKASKMPNGPAWKEYYGEMCRKTVVRRGMKYLPLSAEVVSAISAAVKEEDELTGSQDFNQPRLEAGTKVGFGFKGQKAKQNNNDTNTEQQ